MSGSKEAVQVVSISAEERLVLETILMDADGAAALTFLKQVVLNRLREAENKGMRTLLRP